MTDWQARYLANDTPWEKDAAAPPLLEWLEHHSLVGEVLVPGCGVGHEVRALAAAGANVTGIDLAATAIERANTFPKVGTERFLTADFFVLPADFRGRFDAIFENTCFCAIDPADRTRYVAAAHAALRPKGRLLGIFFLNPAHEVGPPFRVSELELADLFDHDFELIASHQPTAAFPGRAGREQWQTYQKRS